MKPFSEVIKRDLPHLPEADNYAIGTVFELSNGTLWEVIDDESRINDHEYRQVTRYEDENGNLFVVTEPSPTKGD
jgi:hypothetical protein